MTTLGVIRWDGSNTGPVGVNENMALSQAAYHDRLPWYAVELSSTSVESYADNQAVRDQEIDMAQKCGVDYWAFLIYPTEPNWLAPGRGTEGGFTPGMNSGYKLYLTSPKRSAVKHCLMLEGYRAGWSYQPPASDWASFSDAIAPLLVRADYQTVLGNRPLLYWLGLDSFITYVGGGNSGTALTAMNLLRTKVQALGGGNPYIVGLDGNTTPAGLLNADAVSNYAVNPTQSSATGFPYSTLTAGCEAQWADQRAATAYGVVPALSAGWDYRPRNNLAPWVSNGQSTPSWWFTTPTPAQLAAHVQAGFNFVAANPGDCPADTCLMYAWNECTEGGQLQPSRWDYGARLQALASLRRRQGEPRSILRSRGIAQVSR